MGLLRSDSHSVSADQRLNMASPGGFNAVLDRGSEFEGKLTFEGTVRIDGKFKGEVFSQARLVVGESGRVEANVSVDSIAVSGEVIGDITAKSKVELHATAVVRGNIETPKLVMEEGAMVQGTIKMEALSAAHATSTRRVGIEVDDTQRSSELNA